MANSQSEAHPPRDGGGPLFFSESAHGWWRSFRGFGARRISDRPAGHACVKGRGRLPQPAPERSYAVTGKQIDGLPRFILELDPLSGHQRATCWPCSKRSSIVAMTFENSAIGRLACDCPQSNVRNAAQVP